MFGRFTKHRGYKGKTNGRGLVVDLETRKVVVKGLSQPHSLVSDGDNLLLCNSELGEVHE
jgi:hypothetical protein